MSEATEPNAKADGRLGGPPLSQTFKRFAKTQMMPLFPLNLLVFGNNTVIFNRKMLLMLTCNEFMN